MPSNFRAPTCSASLEIRFPAHARAKLIFSSPLLLLFYFLCRRPLGVISIACRGFLLVALEAKCKWPCYGFPSPTRKIPRSASALGLGSRRNAALQKLQKSRALRDPHFRGLVLAFFLPSPLDSTTLTHHYDNYDPFIHSSIGSEERRPRERPSTAAQPQAHSFAHPALSIRHKSQSLTGPLAGPSPAILVVP